MSKHDESKELKALRKELDKARHTAEEWYDDAREGAGERRDLRSQLAAMKTSFDELVVKYDEAMAQLGLAIEAMNTAVGTGAELRYELGVLQGQLDTAHEEIAKLRNQP